MELSKNTKILIVGLGLIGGSYAIRLTKNGYTVGAIDLSRETIDYALKNGCISSGEAEINPAYIAKFDLIIFAIYPHSIISWVKENQQYIKKNAILTDVTGIKSCFIYDVQKILRPDLEFIAAHPMAGRELSGIKYASDKIFEGNNYIVVPTEKNTENAVTLCKKLGEELGFRFIASLSPEKHDETIGFLSQLTHCIAVSLMTCKDLNGMAEYSGDSFRDLTRIAKINDEMWSELFLLNKDKLLKQMELFEASFSKLKEFIKNDNREQIRKIMQKSTKERVLFDKIKENQQ